MKLLTQEKLYQWSNPVVEYRLTGKLRTPYRAVITVLWVPSNILLVGGAGTKPVPPEFNSKHRPGRNTITQNTTKEQDGIARSKQKHATYY